jgi:class 3 adenylate cyclase/DNA-binding NarL/FixJ family response regulator
MVVVGADQPEITVLLADDSVLVREGVRALLGLERDLRVVGTAADFEELLAAADASRPQVVVTDIRMPPTFQDEGIEAAKIVRKRAPGTGIVVLSQFDEPDYAIALLREGAAGYAYLLKDRVADGDRLARAIREVATGGSMLDPEIVAALITPVRSTADLDEAEDALLHDIAEGRPVKAIAAARRITAEAANTAIENLFLKLARGASEGQEGALRRLRLLQQAILEREEQGETLSRMMPAVVAEKLLSDPDARQRTDRLEVTVLMSDIRGYSGISERTDPTVLAGQLDEHRREMNAAILAEDGTLMQYVGDAVMAVFGAPIAQRDHAVRALRAAEAMHRRQAEVNRRWEERGLAPFGLGIGVSTGEVAAAILGSDERLEYTVVGDTVNLAQRLQDLARPAGETVLSEATRAAASRTGAEVTVDTLGDRLVKGRERPVMAHRLLAVADLIGETAGPGA